MEFFLQQIEIVLPVLGLDLLQRLVEPDAAAEAFAGRSSRPLFEIQSVGVGAVAIETDNGFVVRKASTGRADAKAAQNQYKHLQQQLLSEGKLVWADDPAFLVFTEDVSFSSPSAAAAVILDRNANGRTEWKVKGTRQTYAQWQEGQIAAATGTEGA